jgi:hypothetical protein
VATAFKRDDERLVDERPAADFLDSSVRTLQGWRLRKIGPRYYKIGNRVKYALDDLRAYRARCAVEPLTL